MCNRQPTHPKLGLHCLLFTSAWVFTISRQVCEEQKSTSQCLVSTLCSLEEQVMCNVCKLSLRLGFRILVSEPSKGKKKNLIFICFGPCLGSNDDGNRVEMGRQGRKGCLLFGGLRDCESWVSKMALRHCMCKLWSVCLGCVHLLEPVTAGQTMHSCFGRAERACHLILWPEQEYVCLLPYVPHP